MALWDDVKKNLVEWYTVTSEKTSEAARVGSRRWDKFGISRDIERQFSELGSLVYTALKEEREGVLDSEEIQGLVRRIENLEKELKAKDQEIEDIKAEYRREASRKNAGAPPAGEAEFGDASEGDGEDAEFDDGTNDEGDGAGDVATAQVLKDPALGRGHEDSAILVEPENPDPEYPGGDGEGPDNPDKRD